MKANSSRKIDLILNVLIVIMEIISLVYCINTYGNKMFMFYTIDSNLIALLASFLIIINTKNKFIKLLKYISTCMLMVTFLVVIFVLVPTISAKAMIFTMPMPFHHVLCPILAFISYIFFEKTPKLEKKYALYAIIPTIIYAIILIILNYLYIVTGPYSFLMVYDQSIIESLTWLIIIVGGSYIISKIVYYFNK